MSDPTPPNIPRQVVSQKLLFGFLLGGVVTSLLFIVFRLSVRWKLFKRLYWDDFFVVLAWTVFMSIIVAIATTTEGTFYIGTLSAGPKMWTPDGLQDIVNLFKLMIAITILYTTTLWSIKISFLIFFRRIGSNKRSQRIWWWIVTGITIASYIALITANPYNCTKADPARFLTVCLSPTSMHLKRILFYCHLSADIFTDLLIISIPIIMLWNVKMPLNVKLTLMALFSLTIIVVGCVIVRMTVNSAGVGEKQDVTWTLFWATIELTLAIIIACCGAFRQLFKRPGKRNTKSMGTTATSTLSSAKKFLSSSRHDRSRKGLGFVSLDESQPNPTGGGHDIEQALEKESGHIVVSREVEIREVSLPLTQISPAHLAYTPFNATERRQTNISGQDYTFPRSSQMSIKPGFI